MTTSKKDVEKSLKVVKAAIAELELKCKGGSGTKEDYETLAKLKKKIK